MFRGVLVSLVAAVAVAASEPVSPLRLDDAARQWVEERMASLSPAEKAGQLLMPSSPTGPGELTADSLRAHLQLIGRYHVGGWLALGGQAPAARRLLARLQKQSTVPLLVAVDPEGGLGYRLTGATRFPRAMALAAGSSLDEVREAARATAREGLETGIHVAFYPVVDVNTNPANPIISIRSFGDDPERVAELASAFISGLQENGMLATAKHFPGHGDTSTNSHLELPVVASDRRRLEEVELKPFRWAISAGVGLVMTGHLDVPALEPGRPATLSAAAIDGLLRRELGFAGLVVTDALNMRGLPLSLGAGELAVQAFEAGADILLMPTSVADAHRGLLDAVESGRISSERLDASVRRILEAKAHLGLHLGTEPPSRDSGAEARRQLARRLMQHAVTLAADEASLLPLGDSAALRPLIVSVTTAPARRGQAWEWSAQIRRRRSQASVQEVPATFSRLSRQVLVERAAASDLVLLGLYLRVADSSGRIALSDDQQAAVRALAGSSTPLVTVVFGSPYLLGDLPPLPTLVFAFEDYQEAERAAVRALFGEAPFRGRLPVTLPGIAAAGQGLVSNGPAGR